MAAGMPFIPDWIDPSIPAMLSQNVALTIATSTLYFADAPQSHACADVGHLDAYQRGSSLTEIIGSMNGA